MYFSKKAEDHVDQWSVRAFQITVADYYIQKLDMGR